MPGRAIKLRRHLVLRSTSIITFKSAAAVARVCIVPGTAVPVSTIIRTAVRLLVRVQSTTAVFP